MSRSVVAGRLTSRALSLPRGPVAPVSPAAAMLFATLCVVAAGPGCSQAKAPPAKAATRPSPAATPATPTAEPTATESTRGAVPAVAAPTSPAPTSPAPVSSPNGVTTAPASDDDVAAVLRSGKAATDVILERLAAATDEDGRVGAIDDIAKLGAAAEPALSTLLASLEDRDSPRIRWHAARAIGRVGHDAFSAVPRLVQALADADPVVVTQSAAAIGEIRADDTRHESDLPAEDAATFTAALDALVKTASHPSPLARRAALRAVKSFAVGPERLAPLFARSLADSDPTVVLPAIRSLAELGEPSVPLLVQALDDPKSRYWATIALMEIGPQAAAAAAPLTRLLAVGEVDERMQTGLALAAIGEGAATATDELAALLDSPDGALRFTAAYALGRMKAQGVDAALEKASADADEFLATVASWARARTRPDDPAIVDAAVGKLSAGLSSARPNLRAVAVRSIADLRGSIPDAREAELAAAVVPLLADPRPDVARAAAEAVAQMGTTAVAALENALTAPALRLPAVQLLAALGPLSKPAVDSLVVALGDTDPLVRGEAALALASVGSDAAEAIPTLLAIAESTGDAAHDPTSLAGLDEIGTTAGNRLAAAYCLGKIGPAAATAVPALERMADDGGDEILATMASWALLKIEPGKAAHVERAVPRLRKALRSERELVRVEAARALGEIGRPASSALPMLELLREDDPSAMVRQAAPEAILKIRGQPAGR